MNGNLDLGWQVKRGTLHSWIAVPVRKGLSRMATGDLPRNPVSLHVALRSFVFDAYQLFDRVEVDRMTAGAYIYVGDERTPERVASSAPREDDYSGLTPSQ